LSKRIKKLVSFCFECEEDEEVEEFYLTSGLVKFKCGAVSKSEVIKVIAE